MKNRTATTQMDVIKYLQCIKVWGGNQSVDSGVIMPGVGMKFGYAGWKREPWDAPVESSAE